MTRSKDNAKKLNLKEILREQEDLLQGLIQQVVQQVLESEMDETLGAEKGERTANGLGYRSGYYGRTLVTRVGSLSCGCRKTGKAVSARRCSSATSAARRRWWRRSPRCMYKACR